MTTVELGPPITYGTVKCNVGKMVGDITGNPTPDITLLNGKIRISAVGLTQFNIVGPPNYILSVPPEEWNVINGKLVDKNNVEGVRLIASRSAGKLPEVVQYRAEFYLSNTVKAHQPRPVVFEVPANGIVDLAGIISEVPNGPTIKVSSVEDRTAVLQSLQAAQEARADAEEAALAAQNSAEQAIEGAQQAKAAILILGPSDVVPPDTPSNTVVVRTV